MPASMVAAAAAGSSAQTAAAAARSRRMPGRCPQLALQLLQPGVLFSSSGLNSSRSPGSSDGSVGTGSIGSGGRLLCCGFVGDGSRPAGEYHSTDFEWEELLEEGRAAVERQRRELEEHLQQQRQQQQQQQQQQVGGQAAAVAAGARGCASGGGGSGSGDDSWERFHAQQGATARFFKEKRYLVLKCPALAVADPLQHIAEIGCGCGSALLPVLKAIPTCRVTGCDISPTALRLLRRAAEQAGVEAQRTHTFVLDASSSSSSVDGCGTSSGGSGSPMAGLAADALLLVFTLSALAPTKQPAVLAHAYAALSPGGLLLFRDYGLHDLAQLRLPGAQMLGDCLYLRSKGTLAYFLSTDALRALATAAGFEEVECQYARVQLRNRKRGGAPMRRVFVHGVFRKPL